MTTDSYPGTVFVLSICHTIIRHYPKCHASVKFFTALRVQGCHSNESWLKGKALDKEDIFNEHCDFSTVN